MGTCCSEIKKMRYTKLLREFGNVFTQSYEDMKDLRKRKFRHQNPRATPFK